MTSSILLHSGWRLRYGPQAQRAADLARPQIPADWPELPAAVPGNVELDLVRAGLLPEPFEGNETMPALRRLEGFQWWYSLQFPTPAPAPGGRGTLVFEGLDCLGAVWLNGVKLGAVDNMFVEHKFDVADILRPAGAGLNELVVGIDSPVLDARRRTVPPGESAAALNWEGLHLRKAAHMYGWDILPRAVSAGLWRPVRLDFVPPTRWRSVYVATLEADGAARTATVLVDWDFTAAVVDTDGWSVDVVFRRQGAVAHQSAHPVFGTHGRARLALRDVALWRPRGHGEPALYDVEITLRDAAGAPLAVHAARTGFRTVQLVHTDLTSAENPGEFVFVVNGEKLFVKGTNWVPLDAMHSRDPRHLDGAVAMLADLNCNMVRCWGGNVYEDHPFFDRCDELGILVWQDFGMGCAIYPQTAEFAAKIRAEAESVVAKLRNHPSLALWAGNNENDEAHGWAQTGLDPNVHDRLSRDVLPEVVRRLDPVRPYLPSSPYLSSPLFNIPAPARDAYKPEDHLWGPRDDFRSAYYLNSPAHFVSEIGWFGCPDRASLEQMMGAGKVWPWRDNPLWLDRAGCCHPRDPSFRFRVALLAHQAGLLFGGAVPENLDDFVFASQFCQAEALKFWLERFRIGKWRRTGMLWWNLRDGWPAITDAVVDFYGRRKLAYAWLKRLQTDVCVMCADPDAAGRQEVVAVNDTLEPVSCRVAVRDADSGAVLLETDAAIPANGRLVAGVIPAPPGRALRLLEWTVAGTPFRNHYLAGPRPFDLAQCRAWSRLLE